MDRSKSNRRAWDSYKAKEENTRLWSESSLPKRNQEKRVKRSRVWDEFDWYNDRYSHSPEVYDYGYLPTLGNRDYSPSGQIVFRY